MLSKEQRNWLGERDVNADLIARIDATRKRVRAARSRLRSMARLRIDKPAQSALGEIRDALRDLIDDAIRDGDEEMEKGLRAVHEKVESLLDASTIEQQRMEVFKSWRTG